jgi:DNA processing protein
MIKEELAYWYWLSDVKGIGPIISKKLLSEFGSPVAVFDATKDEIMAKTGIRKSLVDNIQQAKGNIQKYLNLSEKQIKMAELLNGHILTGADSSYSGLYARHSSEVALPPVIHLLGDIRLLEGRKFAIVGARTPSDRGKENAFNLALNLAREGFTIVSGLALGIDAEAHRGALKANGRTVAVLGCGADIIYPSSNRSLYTDIQDTGLIVSEFPFGTRPSSENLRKRNRTVVALSEGIVVVECSIRSGAIIAARFATQQRKPIFSFRYPETIDNRGGEWLMSKSLALELTDTTSSAVVRAGASYQAPDTASIDKVFLEIWPKKAKKRAEKKVAKKVKKPEKVKATGESLARAGVSPKSADQQPRLPLDSSSEGQAKAETEKPFAFAVGDSVVHPTFGEGEIARIIAAGDDYQITVQFSRRNVRTFSWRFANLSKI